MHYRLTHLVPDIPEDLLLRLFHKAARTQWTSRDLDWETPLTMTSSQSRALARLLSPVYLGEQTAMLSASYVLPQVAAAGETTAQLFLASFMVDEARHFETLTLLYRKLGCDPIGLREMPGMLRYHHRVRKGDRIDWVWGILISDLFAKHFYKVFGEAREDPLLQAITTKILQDESRHLAFAEHYLCQILPRLDPGRLQALLRTRDELFRLMLAGLDQLRADAAVFYVDGQQFLTQLWEDFANASSRIGLVDGAPSDLPQAPLLLP